MPEFRYRAIGPTGEVIAGRQTAADRSALAAALRRSGHTPLSARELRPGRSWRLSLLARPGLSLPERVLFTRQLATLLRAGLPLHRALELLRDLMTTATGRRTLAAALARIEAGDSFAVALGAGEGGFAPSYLAMVRAGEASGALIAVLERLAGFVEQTEAQQQALRTALAYPAIVAVTCLASLGILFGAVIPQFRPLFEHSGHAVPTVTAIVLELSSLTQRFWPLLAPLALAIALGLRAAWRSPALRTSADRLALHLPVLGSLIRRLETARVCRTLGTLLGNGVALVPALGIARLAVGNQVLADRLARAAETVRDGAGLSAPLAAAGIFPPLAVQLLRVGDETGKPDAMLLRIAEIFEAETRRGIDRLLTLLAPAATILLGAIIATVMGAILTAVMSTYNLAG
ncbi:MAG: type II secretion system F family protein [Acetobacteraceae bacterium]